MGEFFQRDKGLLKPKAGTDDSAFVPHKAFDLFPYRVDVLTTVSAHGQCGVADGIIYLFPMHHRLGAVRGELRHGISGQRSEHRGLGDAVATQPVGSVNSARVFPGDKQPVQAAAAQLVDAHATHVEVSGGGNFDRLAAQIEAHFAAPGRHAGKGALHEFGPQVGNVKQHGSVGGTPSGLDLHVSGSRHHVSRGPLHALRVVALHEPFAQGVKQVTTGASQSLFQHRAGDDRLAGHQAGGMELVHLHVLKHATGPVTQGHAIAALF